MKLLSVQLHLDKLGKDSNVHQFLRIWSSQVITLTRGNDYLTIVFQTSKLKNFWNSVKNALNCLSLDKAAIVVCQGDTGWDDYLLLHSTNSSEETDSLE